MPRKNAQAKAGRGSAKKGNARGKARTTKGMQGGGTVAMPYYFGSSPPSRLTGLDLARQKAAAQARARARPLAPPALSVPSSTGATYLPFLKKGGKVKTSNSKAQKTKR